MNNVIEVLLEQKTKKEIEAKNLQYELDNINKCLSEELHKETNLINKVLKHNIIEIINMIHEQDLKCSAIHNAETIWGITKYKVSDGTYYANIIAKDGTVTIDYSEINNDGGGRTLNEKTKDLIMNKIIPFCEMKKNEYRE
jgi:hypothetical protein